MLKEFDGRGVNRIISDDLKTQVVDFQVAPKLTVISVGDNPLLKKFLKIKENFAKNIGVEFEKVHFSTKISELKIINFIKKSKSSDGIMIQLPLPKNFDRDKIISAIPKEKDVDGLRFCAGLESAFLPPVVLAILKALEKSSVNLKKSKVAIVGFGFLVGSPLKRVLEEKVEKLIVADIETKNLSSVILSADVIISAVGKKHLIKPEMAKDGVALIDAGTTESSGEIFGDIDPDCYRRSSFYSPVPGGIGPVTVAMLFENLVTGFKN